MLGLHMRYWLFFFLCASALDALADIEELYTFSDGTPAKAAEVNANFDLLEAGLPPDSCDEGEIIRRGPNGDWECSADILGALDCADGEQIEYDETNGWRCLTAADCGAPANGVNTVPVTAGTKLTRGDAYQWQCLPGYATADSTIAVCNSDGNFSVADPPTCYQIVCDSPPEGTNTVLVGNGVSLGEGEFYQYQCQAGYATQDETVTLCSSQGSLSLDHAPICDQIVCGVPPSGINTEDPQATLLYLDVYQYQCLPGSSTQDATISVCSPDGTFTLDFPPVCQMELP